MRQTSHEEKELSLQITESSELPEPLVPLSSFVRKTLFHISQIQCRCHALTESLTRCFAYQLRISVNSTTHKRTEPSRTL